MARASSIAVKSGEHFPMYYNEPPKAYRHVLLEGNGHGLWTVVGYFKSKDHAHAVGRDSTTAYIVGTHEVVVG